MRIAILYFTGTGSTAKFGLEIAESFRGQNHEVNMIRLQEFNPNHAENFDIIGIGTPCYAFRSPRYVTTLLKSFPEIKKSYFIFITSGGMPGNTAWNIYKILNKKKWNFIGDFYANGPTNLRSWMPLIEEGPTTWGLSEYDLEQTDNFVDSILSHYNEYSDPSLKLVPKISYSIFTSILNYDWSMRVTVGRKKVDKDSCNKCCLCISSICPTKSIILDKKTGFPKFNEFTCIGCNGCVNICPKNAIYSRRTKSHTQYARYRNLILNPPN